MIEVDSTGIGSLNTAYLSLYNPLTYELMDYSYNNNLTQISFKPTSSGTYYLRVSEMNDDETGNYSVKVSTVSNDTTTPTLTSLIIPSNIDISKGNSVLGISATATDDLSGINKMVIWLDNNLSYSHTVDSTSFSSWKLIGLYGIYDSWTDGRAIETNGISSSNANGTYNITKVDLTDNANNKITYTNSQLKTMGINTSFEITGGATDLPAMQIISSIENGKIILSISTNTWTSSTNTLNFTLNYDSSIGHYEEYKSGGSGAYSVSSYISEIGSSGKLTFNSSISNYGDNTDIIKLVFNPLKTNTNFLYDISSAKINSTYLGITQGEYKIPSAPTITSISTGTVTENAVTSTVIYKATATDANTTLKYSLSGTDAALLNINSTIGNVTLKTSANYEAKKSYSFNVIASDGSLTATKAVIVNVTNVNEFAPTSANKIITINEDSKKVLSLSDFVFKDSDADSSLSKVKITQLETKGNLKLNGKDVILNQEILASDIKAGKLVFTPISNEFGTSYTNFKFQVSDGTKYSTSSYTTTFNVTQVIDTVSKTTSYTLPSLIENLTLTGIANINGTGNSLNNTITGNSANNILNGKSGNDKLNGGAGADTLYGELGNDILNGGIGADIMLGGAGNDTYYVDNVGDKVYETKTTSSTSGDAGGIDKVNSSISYTLTSFVENLSLTGSSNINGTGNSLNNKITGNSAANKLTGGAGNDILDGKAGIDTMIGGTGNDIYYVDSKKDVVTEKKDEGRDKVVSYLESYTLAANVEDLDLLSSAITGIGNALDNTIMGNELDNVLKGGAGADILVGGLGNDTLDGGKGNDYLAGGAGNDTYYVDNEEDEVIELEKEGIDTVISSVTYTLTDYVENLTLTGKSNINGTGNDLDNIIIGNSGANTLTGNAGNDTLDGKAGADRLIGGTGDDIYYVDNVKDVVIEEENEGIDTVYSSVTYTLTDHVENLILSGTKAINGTGNALDNLIIGNTGNNILKGGEGNDTLYGGLGNDTLYGGAGSDKFVFNTTLNASKNKDTIKDFNVLDDTIELENAIFEKLTATGLLNFDNFVSTTDGKAKDSNDYIVYNKNNGQLFYDADGSGKGAAILFAVVENKANLTNADFTVI